MFRGQVAAVAIGMTMVLIAGCGSSSGSDALTKAEFVKQGNTICHDALESKETALIAFLKKHRRDKASPALETTLVTDIVLPPFQTMSTELEELGAPSGEEAKAEAVVEAFSEAIQKMEQDPAAALSGSKDPFADASQLAAKYGLKDCAAI